MADWKDALRALAPTVASALGGPLAGLAVEAISKSIGIPPEDTKKLLETGKLNSDQIAQIQLAEIELKKQEKALGLDFEKLAVDDRKSARDMQALTKSYMPAFLAITVTTGFFGILAALMYGGVEKTDEVMIMLGSLGTAWTGIISFYFGSSSGSQNKDIMLHQSKPIE